MIVTDRFGSTSVSELVNIYTIERNIDHRESNEYEVYKKCLLPKDDYNK